MTMGKIGAAAMVTLLPLLCFGQLKTTIDNGRVRIDDGVLFYRPAKYRAKSDSLDKLLQFKPADTTALFERALLYDLCNDQFTKPVPGDKGALADLAQAEYLVNGAISQKMINIKLRVLRAQIYRDLAWRFTDDQAWKYSASEIKERRIKFESYKALANMYYGELAKRDILRADDFRHRLIVWTYPIKN